MAQVTHYRIDWLHDGTPFQRGKHLYRSHTEACLAAYATQCKCFDSVWSSTSLLGLRVMAELTFNVVPTVAP